MRRKLLAVGLIVLGALAFASPASARPAQTCPCAEAWAGRYTSDAGYQASVQRKLAHRGVGRRGRRKIKRGIYDWQKDHTNLPNWCKRGRQNKKACTAAIVCIGAAAGTILNEGTSRKAWRHAATNCAVAAATVWLAP